MFNIFEKFLPADVTDELTDEEIAAEEKAARIAFHREKVRNGPAKFSTVSNGQVRRARRRGEKSAVRKNFRRDMRNYYEKQRLAATIRGKLQFAGVIPLADGREIPLHDQITSTAWLVQRFGRQVEVDGAPTGFMSFRQADVVDALINAARFYNSATGAGIKFPANFEPAISLAEAGDVIEGVNT